MKQPQKRHNAPHNRHQKFSKHNGRYGAPQGGRSSPAQRNHLQQQFDKYTHLAREATAAGDKILAESHYQFAEHYLRTLNILLAEDAKYQQAQQVQQAQQQAQNANFEQNNISEEGLDQGANTSQASHMQSGSHNEPHLVESHQKPQRPFMNPKSTITLSEEAMPNGKQEEKQGTKYDAESYEKIENLSINTASESHTHGPHAPHAHRSSDDAAPRQRRPRMPRTIKSKATQETPATSASSELTSPGITYEDPKLEDVLHDTSR